MKNSLLKLIFPMGVAILFIILGFNLIKKEDTFAVYTGCANIIFWSVLILFTF